MFTDTSRHGCTAAVRVPASQSGFWRGVGIGVSLEIWTYV